MLNEYLLFSCLIKPCCSRFFKWCIIVALVRLALSAISSDDKNLLDFFASINAINILKQDFSLSLLLNNPRDWEKNCNWVFKSFADGFFNL